MVAKTDRGASGLRKPKRIQSGNLEKNISPNNPLTARTALSSTKSRESADIHVQLPKLLVALSRSYKHLWIKTEDLLEPERHAVHYFVDWLESKCQESRPEKASSINVSKSSTEDWFSAIHHFLDNNNDEQAISALTQQFSLSHNAARDYAVYYREQFNYSTTKESAMKRCQEHVLQLQRGHPGAAAAVVPVDSAPGCGTSSPRSGSYPRHADLSPPHDGRHRRSSKTRPEQNAQRRCAW